MDPKHLKKIPLSLFAVVWASVFFGATTRNAAWVQWMHRVPGGLFSILLVVIASALGFGLWHRHRSREGFRSLAGSDTWREAADPVGLSDRFVGREVELTHDVATVVGAIPDGFWRAMAPAVDDARAPAWPDRT